MPSERRLHPASILFDSARHVRNFALPALVAMFSTSRSADVRIGPLEYGVAGMEVWLLVLLVPSILLSVARYLSFRLRYEDEELVVRSGLVFRNERHLPYARIQNLDAVQNVVHRLLGVVEVRVETGGGKEPEARLSVLPFAAFREMRHRVFAGRSRPDAEVDGGREAVDAGAVEARTLLHLPTRELLLFGFLENKGLVLVGAAYWVLSETGALNRMWEWLFAVNVDVRGLVREVLAAVFRGAPLPAGRLALAVAAVAGFLVVVRLISMAWAFVRLYDFRLTRAGDDLRVEFGLLTRVTATVPLWRVQTVTIHEGWLHRWLDRASVRVETAGGRAGAVTSDREWVAPLLRRAALPALIAGILPGVNTTVAEWQPVHARAFQRAIKPALAVVLIVSALAAIPLGTGAVAVLVPMLIWAVVGTRQYVAHLGWATTEDVVMFRSGWLGRRQTIARVNKIQAVATIESPLDRRASMARLRVDTAGAGGLSHRVDIPYLGTATARDLRDRLAVEAAQTMFRW